MLHQNFQVVFNVVHNYVDFIHVAANNYFLTEENIFASYDHRTIIGDKQQLRAFTDRQEMVETGFTWTYCTHGRKILLIKKKINAFLAGSETRDAAM